MQVSHDSVPPCGVISFFEIEKDSNALLFGHECLSDVCFESDEVVDGVAVFPEATLEFAEVSKLFQIPDESGVNHALHCLT